MASRFQTYSIQKQLVVMGLWASSVALLLATVAFTVYDFVTYQATHLHNLTSVAEIVSINSASALVFNDSTAASHTLESLKARPGVLAAAIYNPQGILFAKWVRDATSPPVFPPLPNNPRSHRLERHHLFVFYPVILDNSQIGTVFIESDLNELNVRLHRYAAIAVLVLVFSVILAAAIANQVGRRISKPILNLTQMAKTVSENKDYSVRALESDSGEIGLLVRTFNQMLGKIQQDGDELRDSEARIRRLNTELEDRVVERTAQLTAANKELEAFSYSVSHDLRTPLRSIDGFSRILLENSSDCLDEEGKNDLKRIRSATQRMAQLIDDLLNLSRVGRSEMNRDDVNLSAMVEKILQELEVLQPERRVKKVIAPNLAAVGDPALLRIVLENLVGNAWKFTERKTEAQIEFGVTEHQAKKAFFIRDNGAGFDMAYYGKLFGVFQRLHDAREFPGTGVGLATVQRIVQRHGGEIWAEAAVEQGATFYFTLA